MKAANAKGTIRAEERQGRIKGRREKRKLARQARLRRQILRYFLLCVFLIAGVSVFTYLPWRITDLERDIAVEGNQVVSAEQVRGALANCIDKPLWKLSPQAMASQVQSLEAVKYAFVRRYLFPLPKISVVVLEEFPWASLAQNPDSANQFVMSESGRLIPIDQFPAVIQPKLRIFGATEANFDAKQVTQWATWIGYIASQTGQPVDFVDLRNANDIRVGDGDLYLKLGSADSSLTRRLSRLASLIPSLGTLRERLVYIDLGLDNNIPLKVMTNQDWSRRNLLLRQAALKDEAMDKSQVNPSSNQADASLTNAAPADAAPVSLAKKIQTANTGLH